jgi:hypothetical protein
MTQSSGELSEFALVVENPRQHRSNVCEAAVRKMTDALGIQLGVELIADQSADVPQADESRFIGGMAAEQASEFLN